MTEQMKDLSDSSGGGSVESSGNVVDNQSGVRRLQQVFEDKNRRAALMPYMMGDYPNAESSRAVMQSYIEGGAGIVELGVPFSDPLADGPVIHTAATVAMAAGSTMSSVLELAGEFGAQVPIVIMCYANQVFGSGGIDRFVERLVNSKVCGLIVPDIPYEEGVELREKCKAAGISHIPLIAPTTSRDRIKMVCAEADSFVYAVSVVGTTGEQVAKDNRFAPIVDRISQQTSLPIAVGFGISTPEDATNVVEAGAKGVIIGSKLVRMIGESASDEAGSSQVVTYLRSVSTRLI